MQPLQESPSDSFFPFLTVTYNDNPSRAHGIITSHANSSLTLKRMTFFAFFLPVLQRTQGSVPLSRRQEEVLRAGHPPGGRDATHTHLLLTTTVFFPREGAAPLWQRAGGLLLHGRAQRQAGGRAGRGRGLQQGGGAEEAVAVRPQDGGGATGERRCVRSTV